MYLMFYCFWTFKSIGVFTMTTHALMIIFVCMGVYISIYTYIWVYIYRYIHFFLGIF